MVNFKKLFVVLSLISCAKVPAKTSGDLPQKLESKIFTVCDKKLSLEIAATQGSRAIGLMHREKGVPEGTGMIFVFEEDEVLQFWMRNVPFAIDIGYFDSKGQLVTSMTMAGTSSLQLDAALPRYSSVKPVRFAVEVTKGFYSKIKTKGCQMSPLPKNP